MFHYIYSLSFHWKLIDKQNSLILNRAWKTVHQYSRNRGRRCCSDVWIKAWLHLGQCCQWLWRGSLQVLSFHTTFHLRPNWKTRGSNQALVAYQVRSLLRSCSPSLSWRDFLFPHLRKNTSIYFENRYPAFLTEFQIFEFQSPACILCMCLFICNSYIVCFQTKKAINSG